MCNIGNFTDSFYLNEESMHDVEMMTDAGDSVVSTAFTRYTVAPSASSKGSKFVPVHHIYAF